MCLMFGNRAVARTLIRVASVYPYIHVLRDKFRFKLINLNLICKETRRAEHDEVNVHPSPN